MVLVCKEKRDEKIDDLFYYRYLILVISLDKIDCILYGVFIFWNFYFKKNIVDLDLLCL